MKLILCFNKMLFLLLLFPEWCSGTLPLPKPNGHVQICLDLTPLNKAVQCETHPMGSVDESLVMLGESRVFTKFSGKFL